MRTPKLINAMNHLDDDLVSDAVTYHPTHQRNSWTRWAAIAVCCIFVFGFGTFAIRNFSSTDDPNAQLSIQPSDTTEYTNSQPLDATEHNKISNEIPEPPQTNDLSVNEVDQFMQADMDVQLSFYEIPLPEIPSSDDQSLTVYNQFSKATGSSLQDFVAMLPDYFIADSFFTVNTPSVPPTNEYHLHDFVLLCKTETGGEAQLSFSALGEPCRDLFIISDNPVESEVNGIPLMIYGYEETYLVQFYHNDLYYDIETQNVTLQELENLLSAVLCNT